MYWGWFKCLFLGNWWLGYYVEDLGCQWVPWWIPTLFYLHTNWPASIALDESKTDEGDEKEATKKKSKTDGKSLTRVSHLYFETALVNFFFNCCCCILDSSDDPPRSQRSNIKYRLDGKQWNLQLLLGPYDQTMGCRIGWFENGNCRKQIIFLHVAITSDWKPDHGIGWSAHSTVRSAISRQGIWFQLKGFIANIIELKRFVE